MISAELFLEELKKINIDIYTGTPCSYLKPFINRVIDDPSLRFVPSTNEGDAVAIAAGAFLAGKSPLVMFQNSGLGNAVNPITSLSYSFKLPFLGIVTLRGEPNGPSDEPQHELMGQITTKLLDLMQVPWAYFPSHNEDIAPSVNKAYVSMKENNLPYFFVMKKGSVEEYSLKEKGPFVQLKELSEIVKAKSEIPVMNRTDALKVISHHVNKMGPIIATTGKTGRELFEIEDSLNNLYMVGSMGCALTMGIGLSLGQIQSKITVIDGDGALMMRMGAMASVGMLKPQNLVHILLDNEVHDSTGGQRSGSEAVSFPIVAKSCGYEFIYEAFSAEELKQALNNLEKQNGPAFIYVKIKSGSPKELGRPTMGPAEVGRRFKKFIEGLNGTTIK